MVYGLRVELSPVMESNGGSSGKWIGSGYCSGTWDLSHHSFIDTGDPATPKIVRSPHPGPQESPGPPAAPEKRTQISIKNKKFSHSEKATPQSWSPWRWLLGSNLGRPPRVCFLGAFRPPSKRGLGTLSAPTAPPTCGKERAGASVEGGVPAAPARLPEI